MIPEDITLSKIRQLQKDKLWNLCSYDSSQIQGHDNQMLSFVG